MNPSTLTEMATDPVFVRCVNTYLAAKAYAATMRDAVEPIHREVLAFWKPTATLHKDDGEAEPITELKDLYLCEDEELCQQVYQDIQERIAAAGFKVQRPGNCPALEAETLELEAARAMVLACNEYLPDLTYDRVACTFTKQDGWALPKFLNILVGLVVNHPKYRAPRLARTT